MANLTQFHIDCHKLFDGVKLFPIEMDLARSAFQTSLESFENNVSEGEEATATYEDDDDEKILNIKDDNNLLKDNCNSEGENLQLLSGLTENQNVNLSENDCTKENKLVDF